MEYYSKVIPMNVLKNHISNDPIIDFFQIQNIKSTSYNQDTNNYFKKYIIKETISYKQDFFTKLKDKINSLHPNNNLYDHLGVNETIHLIKNDYPIIFNPLLIHEKYNISVKVDIIIKTRLFKEIFTEIKNIDIKNINDNEYLIINILPETLHFKSDLKSIQQNEIITFNECCLYVFNSCLKKIIPRPDIGFIFGKEYKSKNILLNKRENIGLVRFNDDIRMKIFNAIEWINRLKTNNYRIIDNKPPTIELYPNMNIKSDYQEEKKKIATQIKEITMVWRISFKERNELIKNDICTWDNPYLIKNLYHMKDSNTKLIQEQMIHMNTQNEILITPRRSLSDNFTKILIPHDNEYILDIESLINLNEKTSYFNDIVSEDKAHICIIGSVHLQDNIYRSYQDFTLNDLNLDEEKNIVINWLNSLKFSEDQKIYIYHWGHAENTYLNNLKKKYSDISWPNIILIDLLYFFREEPILLKGLFNFGLKNVGKILYNNKLIKTTWEETDNGLDAVIRFKQICENKNKNIPLKRYNEIAEIINYNKIDCLVLTEILMFLRERYL